MSGSSFSNFNPGYTGFDFLKGINPYTTKYPIDFASFAGKYYSPTTPATSDAVPSASAVDWTNISQNVKDQLALQQALLPSYLDLAKKTAQFGTEETLKQAQGFFPYYSAASALATARNLAASEKFAGFKESLPTSQQAIVASKQGQQKTASEAEYLRALGMSAQQQAATDFARRYGSSLA